MADNVTSLSDANAGGEPASFIPADAEKTELALSEYEKLNEAKKEYADKQKVLLDEFNRNHSCAPFVMKFLRKLRNMEQPEQGGAVRALIHGINTLKLNEQQDMYDDVQTPDASEAHEIAASGDGWGGQVHADEEWDEAAPQSAVQ